MGSSEIQYFYTKQRREFGKQLRLTECHTTHCVIDANPALRVDWIREPTVSCGQQATVDMSENEINTEHQELRNRGCNHTEGGWPKDVNAQDIDHVARFRRKAEKEDDYIDTILKLGAVMEEAVKLNNTVDIYEEYFGEEDDHAAEEPAARPGSARLGSARHRYTVKPPSAKSIFAFHDPDERQHMAVAHLAWNPNAHKLAVAYCSTEFQPITVDTRVNSYVWDIEKATHADFTISPISPLVCLQFCPKDPQVIAGASYSGLIGLWDVRQSSYAIAMNNPQTSHSSPAYKLQWINSKTGKELFSAAEDGYVHWWDSRKMREPQETLYLDPLGKGRGGKVYQATTLEYEPSIPSKFMVGSASGDILLCNRKGKAATDKFTHVWKQAVHGPVYALQRNPTHPKYFLCIADWSPRLFCEDFKEGPALSFKVQEAYLTDGLWNPVRAGVFCVTKDNGTLDIWDLILKQTEPSLRIKLTDESSQCLAITGDGRHVAVGSARGYTTVLELSDELVETGKREKLLTQNMFELETRRERIVEGRQKELRSKKVREQLAASRSPSAMRPEFARSSKVAPAITEIVIQKPAGEEGEGEGEGGEEEGKGSQSRIEELEREFEEFTQKEGERIQNYYANTRIFRQPDEPRSSQDGTILPDV